MDEKEPTAACGIFAESTGEMPMFKPTEEYYRKRAERARELVVTLPAWAGQHLLTEALNFEALTRLKALEQHPEAA